MRNSLFLLSAILLSPVVVFAQSSEVKSAQLHLGQDRGAQVSEEPIRIDFEDFAEGTYITGQEWASSGVTIDVESHRQRQDGSGSLPLRQYNSNCVRRPTANNPLPKCSGGDHDLATGGEFGTEPQGNVLIIQEDNSHKSKNNGTMGDPDDDVRGGLITFSFAQAVSILSFGFLDFDDQDRGEGYIRAYTGADDQEAAVSFALSSLQYLVNPNYTGDNSLREFDEFGDGTFRRLEVEYPGSGAITHLEVAPGGSANWMGQEDSHLW